ncbi:MAG TPA: hypothetical protein VFZ69_02495 [Longimicrobiales bacterium]
MVVLIASYLLLVFVLPVALSAIVSYRALPLGRRCPHCGSDTIPLLARPLRFLSALRRTRLEKRWCYGCGWEGITRVSTPAPTPAPTPAQPPAPRPVAAPLPRATQTLDVRSLHVDGAAWRVMLQCWGNTGVFYGRLVFVAPTGRLWLDAVQSFRGADQHEVLGQALSLPEGLLENRLRRLVTER